MGKYQKILPIFDIWPHGQAVKTSPFHGAIRGSIPLQATKENFTLGLKSRQRFDDFLHSRSKFSSSRPNEKHKAFAATFVFYF